MKKRLVVAVMVLLTLGIGIAGCSAEAGIDSNSSNDSKAPVEQEQQSTEQQVESSDQINGTNEISIIAKSGSQAPSDEKEAILDEITRELDEILDSVNAFEEVDESDLN